MSAGQAGLPEVDDLLPWPASGAVERERHDRRGTVLTMLDVTPAAGGPAQRMVLEQYRPHYEEGDGTWAAEVGRQLEAAGLRAPAPDRVALSYGVLPGGAAVRAREHAPGVSWRSTVGAPEAARAASAVGRWIRTLQAPGPLRPARDPPGP